MPGDARKATMTRMVKLAPSTGMSAAIFLLLLLVNDLVTIEVRGVRVYLRDLSSCRGRWKL
jgi:hypothetical protein